MRLLYSVLWWFVLPFAVLRLLIRSRLEPGYRRNIGERIGCCPPYPAGARPVWVHAVSVGETHAAAPLIREILARYPDSRILLTHMTPTGRAAGGQLFGEEIKTGRLTQCYLPYDITPFIRSFLTHYQPLTCLIFETEIWPNLVFACKKAGVPVALVNARLSERSLRKGRRFSSIMKQVAEGFSIVCAQTETDADRLRAFGSNTITVSGSVKFDITPPVPLTEKGKALRRYFDRENVFMCASTREGEEPKLLDALGTLDAGTLLLLVPRHPQRFDAVAGELGKRNIAYVRRSGLDFENGGTLPKNVRCVLGDSMGEMFMYYSACDAAFIGGSLEKLGGQNLIEAFAVGKPVLAGPHTFNFEAITEDAVKEGIAFRITDATDVMAKANALLADKAKLSETGKKALSFAARCRGATDKTLEALKPVLPGSSG